MAKKFSKSKIANSIMWKMLERSATQIIQFIVQIILARLLLPSDFGVVGIIMVFINMSAIMVNGGFSTALIQKKEVSNDDYSSIWCISMIFSLILCLVVFFSAPSISTYFNLPNLSQMLRVLSVTLVIGTFISIQQVIVARELLFKKLFLCGIAAASIAGVTGVAMAIYGFGVWSLVLQQLIFQLTMFLGLWFSVNWRPRFRLVPASVKSLFNFGWRILAINIMDAINENIRSMLIGKRYSPNMLGYYDRGKTIPQIIINNVIVAIQTVMLPTLSAYQDEASTIKTLLRRSIKMSSYIIFPLMIGLAVIAEPLVLVLLTDKWLPTVPFVKIFCVTYLIYPINSANLQATTALGRSDILLRNDIIKKTLALVILILAVYSFDSTFAVAMSMLLSTMVATIISMYPNKLLLHYTYKEQFSDVLPSLVLSLIMGSLISMINYLRLDGLTTIALQISVGVLTYLFLSALLKLDEYKYIKNMIKEIIIR